MKKVDGTYTVISFEEDFKINLLKCIIRSKNNVLLSNDSNFQKSPNNGDDANQE